ncbi:autotransporter assembly complex protein TamA [Pseudoalteromonas sp. T1lg65]|uniref:autotransporter assembly complex protein TamA n=1 Tax=Pseudoalteromonas sp. T1lg65 TaxID=2077101 RepID=UPI003F793258
MSNSNLLANVIKRFFISVFFAAVLTSHYSFAEPTQRPFSSTIKEIQINVENSSVRDNIAGFLAQYQGKTPNKLVMKELKARTDKALQALGYYQYDLVFAMNNGVLTLSVALKEPVIWREIDIRLVGEGQQDSVLKELSAQLPIKQGIQVNHADYEQTKALFESELLERGYFTFRWLETKLEVHRKKGYGIARLHLDTGPRFVFGNIVIGGDTRASEYITNQVTFEPGQPFLANTLSEFNQILNKMPYFSSVRVYPLLKERVNKHVPIGIHVEDKPSNSFEIGGGYGDDVGAKARFKWVKPWVTSAGHTFESNLRLSQKQQDITASYTIPVDDPNDDVWRVLAGYQLQDDVTDGVDSKIWNIQLQRQWLTSDHWVRTAFIKREHESTEQQGDIQRTEMLIPGISYLKKQAKGGALPFWGNERLISIEFAADDLLSSVDMLKLRWNNQWLRNSGDKHLYIARLDLGAIVTENIELLPFNHRFLAGGDQSVRGFAYESIGPKDDEGKVLGGKYLATASLEYNYQFHPKWRLALFSDAGTATNDFSEQVEVGAGFGFRYLTPVGPIRLDHAWGLTKDSKSTRLSIVIGPEI